MEKIAINIQMALKDISATSIQKHKQNSRKWWNKTDYLWTRQATNLWVFIVFKKEQKGDDMAQFHRTSKYK